MKDLQTAPIDLFFYWINERHRIYLKRMAGEPKPWTADPILRDYKFTNAFRQLDAGTVWLTKNFLDPHRDAPFEEIAFNICWYRMFNWTGTAEVLGWKTDWRGADIEALLEQRLSEGEQVFTGAHIVWSEPGIPKVDAIVSYCSRLFDLRFKLAETARGTRSLEKTFDLLQTVKGVGGFMGYEMVSDMRWTVLLNDATDIMTWANPGPGAIRGLRRLELKHKPREEAIRSMKMLLDISDNRYASDSPWGKVREDHVPDLEMREIEHSLCEFDKYCRVKFGEGEPRSKYPGAV